MPGCQLLSHRTSRHLYAGDAVVSAFGPRLLELASPLDITASRNRGKGCGRKKLGEGRRVCS